MMLQYPHDAMGLIIGKGGRRIADIQKISGAQVEFHNQTPGSTWRQVEVTGTPAAIAAAKELLDLDRGLVAVEAGYEIRIGKMVPAEASVKNDMLVGAPAGANPVWAPRTSPAPGAAVYNQQSPV